MIIAFWLCLAIVFYTYLGYGVLLYTLIFLRRLFIGPRKVPVFKASAAPSCTLIIAAYNEEDIILHKIINTLELSYPKDKLEIIFISDGSTDKTVEIISAYPQIQNMYHPVRKGKAAAVHRAMECSASDIVIYSDANTMLNKNALVNIARHYVNERVGAIAGEKKVYTTVKAEAAPSGEGFYWKYESKLKKWDSELYSTIGAAGELFSIRRSLYSPVPEDTILDDFMISMFVAKHGYRIVYEPEAYAIEHTSANISEELKRKIRIAAGGIQSIVRLRALFNIFKYGVLSFQYISHRVLRWTITPFLLIALVLLNLQIVDGTDHRIYSLLLFGQALFYLLALTGLIFERRRVSIKIFFIPYYFVIMNYAVIAGIKRYVLNQQSAVWEKAKRKQSEHT